jgi:glycosyltransferase involved in cell wall biosynthesis
LTAIQGGLLVAGKPLRILQILRAPIGGLFRHVNDLTKELAARGHDVGIVVDSLASDAQTQTRLDALAPLATLGIHSFPMPRVFGRGDLTTPGKIRTLAGKLNVDVLHGHGAKGGFGARLARIGNKKRVALYTPHGGVLNYRVGSPSGLIFRLLEQALVPHTDGLIFESGFAQSAFHRMIAVPACPGPVIYNGIAPSEFEAIVPSPDAHDFVFIGEFRELKGIFYLLEALVGVRAPDGRRATLIMAGDGPDFEAARTRIETLGLGGRVTLAGVQPARRMLALGLCAVVPSLAESLPYVVLEAAAACRPVIATDVGGISEIFGPTAPRLIASGDAAALRTAMQDFMDHPDAADLEMKMRLEFIRTRFSIEAMTDDIEALYRKVIETR